MCKVVQKFHVVPPTACVLKDLSFSTAECFVQLINFAYQFLHKEIINVRRFGCAKQLIVHNYVKIRSNTWSGFQILFNMTTFVFYPVKIFVVHETLNSFLQWSQLQLKLHLKLSQLGFHLMF